MMSARIHYKYETLRDFATALGEKAGLPDQRARVQAEVLLEADLMGHTTHGLHQLPGLLKNLTSGAIRGAGDPEVISDSGAAVMWDGLSLPGTWLLSSAIAQACDRAASMPIVTYVIRHAANIASLGAYLRQATDRGFVIWVMNADPAMRTVAPAGGIDAQLAPDPLAFGYPTEGDPILIDISTSAVANGWVRRWASEGRKLPAPWLQDAEGKLSDDPQTLFGTPPGSMLPLGGIDLGHKGFALALIVEILTAGLAGTGRSNGAKGGTPVFLQIINPDAFSGRAFLKREGSWLAEACRQSRPRADQSAVRMPGDKANELRRKQLESGVVLHPTIMPELEKWAVQLGVSPPARLPGESA